MIQEPRTAASPAGMPAQGRPLRITFLINSMEGGGAERAMSNLLHHLLPRLDRHRVDLLLLDDREIAQTLPEDLPRHVLDGRQGLLRSHAQLCRHWRQPADRPDICISFLARANVLNVALARRFGHRAVISERVHTSSHIAASRVAPVLRWITRRTYPRAARVVAVSRGVAEDLAGSFGVDPARISVIGNAIDGTQLRRLAAEAPALALPHDFLLGVGRLVPNKNFAMLIEAFARARACSASALVLLGQGPEEQALRAQAARLGVSDRVVFGGFVDNPYPVMSRARALLSASRAEGFPNTIVEALALGCPVVATDCPWGPADVLGSQACAGPPWPSDAHGIVIAMEDREAMSAAMETLCNDAVRQEYAARAASRAAAFGHKAIVDAYVDVILNAETDCLA